MKKTCSQCRQEKPIQRFNTCVDCLRKSDKIKRNMIKSGTLSRKKVVVDNSLAGKMKSDIFLRIAFNFISTSKAQSKMLGFTDKNDMDFTVFELADRLRDTKNCEKCGAKLDYSDLLNSNNVTRDVEALDRNAHVDQIKSIIGGGELKAYNLRVVCSACNTKK